MTPPQNGSAARSTSPPAPDDEAAGSVAGRLAGMLLLGAGALFLGVAGYLFGVLLPAGVTFEMFDSPAAMLDWLTGHSQLYAGMYYLYLAQQAVLLGAMVAVHRWWRHARGAGAWGGDAALAAGAVAVVLAVASVAMLVMAAHGGAAAWAGVSDPERRFVVLTGYEAGADFGKGLRVLSEAFLGWWLGWLGWTVRRSGGSPRWYALVGVGGWTALVGLWKFVDPLMPLEDWLAFVVSLALIVAGLGLRAVAADPARSVVVGR